MLRGTAALAGFPMEDLGLPEFALLRTFHDRRLQIAWEIHGWPELCVTEERALRPRWDTSGGTLYAAGAEVFDGATKTYLQSLVEENDQPPSTGGNANLAYWAPCQNRYEATVWASGTVYAVGDIVSSPDDFAAYQCIAAHTAGSTMDYDQFGKLAVFNRCLPWEPADAEAVGEFLRIFDRDPRATTKTAGIGFTLSVDGAQLVEYSRGLPPTLWVQYRKRRPELMGDMFDAERAYAPKEQVYFVSTLGTKPGNFWTCVQTTAAGETPDTAARKWRKVELPYTFRGYLIQGGYADWLTSDGQPDKARLAEGQALEMLELEADKLQRQQGNVNRLTVRK